MMVPVVSDNVAELGGADNPYIPVNITKKSFVLPTQGIDEIAGGS